METGAVLDIPRPISSYCFYKDVCPSPKSYPIAAANNAVEVDDNKHDGNM